MTIHPVPQDAPADSLRSTAYDSVWTAEPTPTKQPEGFERMMVADGKINVVLAVVLIIWIGLLVFLFRTDRRLNRLERQLDIDE
jgi:CcmD family protein